jgi:hypothetical protein
LHALIAWRPRERRGRGGRRCEDETGGARGREGPWWSRQSSTVRGRGRLRPAGRGGGQSQVDEEVGDCRDGDVEGVSEGLVESDLELREVARRVKRDKLHQSMHCDGCLPQVVDGFQSGRFY